MSFVEQWKASGQSKFTFARAHGIQETTFCHWVLKSLEQESGRVRASSLPVTATPSQGGLPSFVAIQIDNGSGEKKPEVPVMEITMANGSRISFYETVSPEYLQSLLK